MKDRKFHGQRKLLTMRFQERNIIVKIKREQI